jgi:ribonuclease HI
MAKRLVATSSRPKSTSPSLKKVRKKAEPKVSGPASDEPVLPQLELYADGACTGNPGPGGWGYILRDPQSGREKEESGADPQTTNNRMELTAVIEGLRALRKPSRVRVVSDSQYVVNGLKEWLDGWKARGWRKADKSPVLNRELWEELDGLRNVHQLEPEWIRGHQGHHFNERCDRLAVAAIERVRKG